MPHRIPKSVSVSRTDPRAQYVADSRRAQGFPPQVMDVDALRLISRELSTPNQADSVVVKPRPTSGPSRSNEDPIQKSA